MQFDRLILSLRSHLLSGATLRLVILATLAILWAGNAAGQQPAPQKLTLEQVEGLITHNVPDATLSNQIRIHGLTFSPTQAILDELRTKGAGQLTLAAVSANKAPASAATPAASAKPSDGRAPAPKKNSHSASLPGKIELQTEPGSAVILDGKPAGNADAQGVLSLTAVAGGNHELIAKNDGYQDAHLQFALASNEDKQASLPLVWQGGYLAVSSQPVGAAVTVAGPSALTVGSTEVKCPPGTYSVTASLDGYLPQTRTMQVAAGEHHNETIVLVVDPAVILRKLEDARTKLAAGDSAIAEQLANTVLNQSPNDLDATVIVAEAAFQLGDLNRFVDAGARAIRGGKQVTVRTQHVHAAMSLWIHPVDLTISAAQISVVSNPPDSRCKIPSSMGFDSIQSVEVLRAPQRGFLSLHIQYASKPHGVILHELDLVPDIAQIVTMRAPGQVFGNGVASIQEPQNAAQILDAIDRLIVAARR